MTVSPSSATLVPGAQQHFSAAVSGATNQAVTWQVDGGTGGNATLGTITSAGQYTAPASVPKPPLVTVSAVAQAGGMGSAAVTISPPQGAANQTPQTPPIELGTSGGNLNDSTTSGTTTTCCSGTLGVLVIRAGTQYILSNNHVLARSNQATLGELIGQPGLVDTEPNHCDPTRATPVATLSQFVQLPSGGTDSAPVPGTVDAALAAVTPSMVDPSGRILGFGPSPDTCLQSPSNSACAAAPALAPALPALAMKVAKAGRSTGLTCSTIDAINARVKVAYQSKCSKTAPNFTVVEFDNQVSVSGQQFSQGGDSGSLMVNAQTAQPIALLFAGSDGAPFETIGNPIAQVLNHLADPNTGAVPVIVGGGQHSIACPAGSVGAIAANVTTAVPEAEKARAANVSMRNATRLMRNLAVSGVAVGTSEDSPGEAAILVTINSARLEGKLARDVVPATIDGVRTRIVPGTSSALAEAEIRRGSAVKARVARGLMRNPAVFAVGVGASNDSPGEAALVVVVDKNTTYTPPAVIEGVRTKVVRGGRFVASGWNESAQPQSCSLKRHN